MNDKLKVEKGTGYIVGDKMFRTEYEAKAFVLKEKIGRISADGQLFASIEYVSGWVVSPDDLFLWISKNIEICRDIIELAEENIKK